MIHVANAIISHSQYIAVNDFASVWADWCGAHALYCGTWSRSSFSVRCVQDGCRQEQTVDQGQEGRQEEDVSGYGRVINTIKFLYNRSKWRIISLRERINLDRVSIHL